MVCNAHHRKFENFGFWCKTLFGKSAIVLIGYLNIKQRFRIQNSKSKCSQIWNFQMLLVRAQPVPSCPARAQTQQSSFRKVSRSYLNSFTKIRNLRIWDCGNPIIGQFGESVISLFRFLCKRNVIWASKPRTLNVPYCITKEK